MASATRTKPEGEEIALVISQLRVVLFTALALLLFTPAALRAQAVIVDTVPSHRITSESASGELRFASVAAATVAVSGRVAVLDATSNSLVFIDANGAVRSRLESTGRGPCEVASMRAMCGDPSGRSVVLEPL